MTVVAARTSRMIQYEEIAREVGVSAPTVKNWLSILVSGGIVALVQPYHNNVLKRVVKAPLLHFLDTGLCAFLLKWDNAETLERGAASGAFFESYVFSEIYKSYLNAGRTPSIYYYRDRDQKEIDLLIYENGTLYPVEIKKTASPDRRMAALSPSGWLAMGYNRMYTPHKGKGGKNGFRYFPFVRQRLLFRYLLL